METDLRNGLLLSLFRTGVQFWLGLSTVSIWCFDSIALEAEHNP